MKTEQLLHQSFHVSKAFGVLGRRVQFIADGGRLRLYTPTQEFQNWMETLRNGYEAYGLTEKRLGETYKCKVRAMDYPSKIKALEQRSSYFGEWQNEVAERLTGKKAASMEKYGTPATKTMENTRISSEGKRSIEGLLKEHGLESRLSEFQFTSVTTLRTEGIFRVYNRDQVVPSALEFKYLSSRSALECAMKSAMGLGFKRKRETHYEHRDDCQMPLLYTKRKDDRSFIKESSRVKKEALDMRDFCRVYGKGVKVSGARQVYKQRPGSLPLDGRKPKATVTLHDQESAPLLQWLDSVTKQNEGKKWRAKGKEPGVSTEQPSEASEKSVVVVGHRVTKDGVEYLVKGTQEPNSAGMWIPRENVDLTLVAAYTRRQRVSRCST